MKLNCKSCASELIAYGKRVKTAKYCGFGCYWNSMRGLKKGGKTICDIHTEYTNNCVECRKIRATYAQEKRWAKGGMKAGSKEHIKYLSERQKNYLKENGHPMLGKHHTLESRIKNSASKRTGRIVKCSTCSIDIYRRPSQIHEKNFCGYKCVSISYKQNHKEDKYRIYIKFLRRTKEWANWRKSVFKRDSYTCQDCGRNKIYIEPHHIIPTRIDITKVFDINNGVTLCRPCHQKTIWKESDCVERYSTLITAQM